MEHAGENTVLLQAFSAVFTCASSSNAGAALFKLLGVQLYVFLTYHIPFIILGLPPPPRPRCSTAVFRRRGCQRRGELVANHGIGVQLWVARRLR